jgi:hypothetical protein
MSGAGGVIDLTFMEIADDTGVFNQYKFICFFNHIIRVDTVHCRLLGKQRKRKSFEEEKGNVSMFFDLSDPILGRLESDSTGQ